jgi:ribosomal-protein-alanine N-acetyltransferase
MSKSIIETERLSLRELSADEDAEFILELVNEPAWIRNIGDRGIRTREAARDYILNRIASSYELNGFGLYLVALKDSGEPAGICGLIKRDSLDDVDIGFAFLERCWSKGYAVESAAAVMNHARRSLGLKRIVAITIPDNRGSIKVLEKIGLRFEKMIKMPGDEEEIMLFASD